jgi:hypothetical protein
MRTKYVTGATVTDLGTTLPFVPNNDVVALNPTASAVTLQFSTAATGPFATAAVIPAGASTKVSIAGRYAAIENGVGQVQLIQN